MTDGCKIDAIFETLSEMAENAAQYADAWKQRTGGKIVGVFPMNFPLELVHAAGALPVVVQASRVPITLGRNLLFEFYCGYTRSIADQAATGQLSQFDGFFLVDHCVALLGAADAMRFQMPQVPIYLAQYPASMDETTSRPQVADQVAALRGELATLCGTSVSDSAISRSITLFNRNRKLQRRVYELRRTGHCSLSGIQLQAMVKSSMVADIEEHTALLEALVPLLEAEQAVSTRKVRLHISGHFCHAPQPELLDMIENCGAIIVDDDLYTGFRFISADVPETGDPIADLVEWYFARNRAAPCSTRAQKDVDWEEFLLRSLESSEAEGIIILMAKFCEPHMLYFPELRKAFDRKGIPYLLIETEQEGLALEMLRTRVEALVERIRQTRSAERILA